MWFQKVEKFGINNNPVLLSTVKYYSYWWFTKISVFFIYYFLEYLFALIYFYFILLLFFLSLFLFTCILAGIETEPLLPSLMFSVCHCWLQFADSPVRIPWYIYTYTDGICAHCWHPLTVKKTLLIIRQSGKFNLNNKLTNSFIY